MYDNYNALAIGWGATERASDVIVSIAAFPRGVSLYFIHGKKLTDPGRLLQGSGSQGRFIRLDTIATLDLPDVKVLLTEAASQSNASLRRTGKPHTVIKSISARQRPRRPGK